MAGRAVGTCVSPAGSGPCGAAYYLSSASGTPARLPAPQGAHPGVSPLLYFSCSGLPRKDEVSWGPAQGTLSSGDIVQLFLWL